MRKGEMKRSRKERAFLWLCGAVEELLQAFIQHLSHVRFLLSVVRVPIPFCRPQFSRNVNTSCVVSARQPADMRCWRRVPKACWPWSDV